MCLRYRRYGRRHVSTRSRSYVRSRTKRSLSLWSTSSANIYKPNTHLLRLLESLRTYISQRSQEMGVNPSRSREFNLEPGSLNIEDVGNVDTSSSRNRQWDCRELLTYPKSWQRPIPRGATLKSLKVAHQFHSENWRDSRIYQGYQTVFQKTIQQPSLKITSAVCLGLGSLREGLSMKQLVFFESLVEILRQHHTIPQAHIYFQDPEFNLLDRSFLESRCYR